MLFDLLCDHHISAAAAPAHFPNCCFWAELTARSACRCRCLCWSRAAARDTGRLVGGRCMVPKRYELFCSLICCATITFLHRYALCVYITHPTSGQRHFSCRYSDPASSILGEDILQESRGDRWCPRCESVVNEVVLVRNMQRPPRHFHGHTTQSIYTQKTNLVTSCGLWVVGGPIKSGRQEPKLWVLVYFVWCGHGSDEVGAACF